LLDGNRALSLRSARTIGIGFANTPILHRMIAFCLPAFSSRARCYIEGQRYTTDIHCHTAQFFGCAPASAFSLSSRERSRYHGNSNASNKGTHIFFVMGLNGWFRRF
jgi:hypothetical protein